MMGGFFFLTPPKASCVCSTYIINLKKLKLDKQDLLQFRKITFFKYKTFIRAVKHLFCLLEICLNESNV